MRYACVLWIALALTGACKKPPPGQAKGNEPDPLSVTRWTDRTELFAEYPALVVGQTSRFAIHLTRLEPFKAVSDGGVEVQLRGAGGDVESFRVDKPSRPGIFGVDVKPTRGGTRQMVIALRSPTLTDEHRVGEVEVHADAAAARSAPPPKAAVEGISFLKEQQWALDFGTAVVREQSVRESIRVPAELAPRPGGQADVVAPIDGRLVQVADLAVGASVTRGQELAHLLPSPSAPGELPSLQQARVEAIAAGEFAVRDRERAERLVAAGAAPQKRLDEAKTTETQAAARLMAAEARIAQYNAARTAGGGAAASQFIVRAPVGGVVATRTATPGANVTGGTTLFRIVDAAQVHVVGHVPEVNTPQVRRALTAEVDVPGQPAAIPAGRQVSIGKVLDPASRTLPVVFTFDNRQLGIPVGQSVFLRLLLPQTSTAPVIPQSAIVDDAGRPIVFVQTEGETFERRPVTLGARQGDLVQVSSGVKTGERVVSKGAHLVRLASLSTQVPSHGHVH